MGRLFYGNVHFDERDDLEVRWKSRKSQSKRAQRATATHLSAWSMPCPEPLRTWAQPLIEADLKLVASEKFTTVEGKSILHHTLVAGSCTEAKLRHLIAVTRNDNGTGPSGPLQLIMKIAVHARRLPREP